VCKRCVSLGTRFFFPGPLSAIFLESIPQRVIYLIDIFITIILMSNLKLN
jgi:hypothetical protein